MTREDSELDLASPQAEPSLKDYCCSQRIVRLGRRRAMADPEHSHWCPSEAMDSQTLGSTFDMTVISQLGTATSLPLLGIQAPAVMACHVNGLSSPAAHTTLAAAETLAPNTPTSTAAEAAATAAAMAAFSRSMTWKPDLYGAGGIDRGHTSRLGGCAANGAGASSASADDLTQTQLPSSAEGGCPRSTSESGCTAGLPEFLRPASSSHHQHHHQHHHHCHAVMMALARGQLSTRRGLYEGTMRGGSIRNTWGYVALRPTM